LISHILLNINITGEPVYSVASLADYRCSYNSQYYRCSNIIDVHIIANIIDVHIIANIIDVHIIANTMFYEFHMHMYLAKLSILVSLYEKNIRVCKIIDNIHMFHK